MKRTVIALAIGMVGAFAVATVANAQGFVYLDNYASSGNVITYGAGSDGSAGSPLGPGYSIGMYWALGTVSVGADPTGIADPSTLSGGLQLATGSGSTSSIIGSGAQAGYFTAINAFQVPGSSAGGTATFEIVAYEGASYGAATYRGHSDAFQVTLAANSGAAYIGKLPGGMPGFSSFSVSVIPEPATFALLGLGGLSLMLIRRRK